jgi:hypothetical protein
MKPVFILVNRLFEGKPIEVQKQKSQEQKTPNEAKMSLWFDLSGFC